MKRILIIHSNMELGGAETSLLGLLQSLDYSAYSVDLLLFERKGELLSMIPKQVHIMEDDYGYGCLTLPIKEVLLKRHAVFITFARLLGKWKGRNWKGRTYMTKQYSHKYAMPFLRRIPGEYDLAISFIDPHYVLKKVNAKVKAGWLHTDFSRIKVKEQQDKKMWSCCDYIVHISESCKEVFDKKYPEFVTKTVFMNNILSSDYLHKRATEVDVSNEMEEDSSIKLLSIGRFCEAKNFDNLPDICKKVRAMGHDIKWYIIGYGGDEALIRQKIAEAGMEDYVILLGKKDNPYPYIATCDLYVQPSRYEGKSVTVREAQTLCKPVVITRYATSANQLEDGIDGVIVPMDNEGCAAGIADLLSNPEKMRRLSEACAERDYSNAAEVNVLYCLMDKGDSVPSGKS